MTEGKVEFGMDFSKPIQNIKKNEASLREASKSMERQGKLVDQVIANQQRMLNSLLGGNRGVSIPATADQIRLSRQTRRLGGVEPPFGGGNRGFDPFANKGGGTGGGGRPPTPPGDKKDEGGSLAGGMMKAALSLGAFATAVNMAKGALEGIKAAGEAGKEAGNMKTLAARASKELGGSKAYYENAFDNMSDDERKQAASFLNATITRKQTQFVKTPLKAVHGGLSGIRSGDITGEVATSMMSEGMYPQLSGYGKSQFLTPEMKFRALEGKVQGRARNADYDTRMGTRLWTAQTEAAKLHAPGTMGALGKVPFVGELLQDFAGAAISGTTGEVAPGRLAGPGGGSARPGPRDSRSGDMQSGRGNEGLVDALRRNTDALNRANNNQERPPVDAGKR